MNKEFKIIDPVGLHARPATLLVNEAGKFSSDSKISVDGKEVNLKSIMGVMSLAIANGQTISISVEGDDASEALDALTNVIIENKIGE